MQAGPEGPAFFIFNRVVPIPHLCVFILQGTPDSLLSIKPFSGLEPASCCLQLGLEDEVFILIL